VFDNSYVVFYSDNGYDMGEHRLPRKEDLALHRGHPLPDHHARPQHSSRRLARGDGTEYRPQAHVRGHTQTPSCVDGVSFLRTATIGAPFLRRYALSESLGGARSWGNGVQGYYEVTADRCQLESTPDYSHAALMHRVLVRMKDCDGAECRMSGP
jgi:hypothetical protein